MDCHEWLVRSSESAHRRREAFSVRRRERARLLEDSGCGTVSALFGIVRSVRRALAWLRSFFRDLRRIVAPSQIDKFRQAGWNELIYGSFDHGSSPVIVVFGGFTGDSCAQWISKWTNAQLFVYEPVTAWAALLKERFRDADVRVFEYGVGARSENRQMFLKGDASSALPQRFMNPSGEGQIEVLFKSVAEAAGA